MLLGVLKLQLVTDLLEISSLQGLISDLTKVHISVVMAQFSLPRTHRQTDTHTRINHCNLDLKFNVVVCPPTLRQGGASRSVVSRKQPRDDFLFEP